MKKSLSSLVALTLALPLAAFAQGTMKIGTVDVERAFKEYNKTKDAEQKARTPQTLRERNTTAARKITKRRPTKSTI